MTQNRFYSSVGLPSTLAAAITSSGQSPISVNSITGNPTSFPYTLLIDWGLPTQEAVSVTASSGTGPYSLTVTRGIDGTTAQTHVNGAVVVHGVSAEDYNEPQVHISTGTSSGSYPGVIHGLQAGSSVVGTTDAQTLTNKTLGATTITGATTLSASSATGLLVTVTNTHSSPSNPNVEWVAAGVADSVVGIQVSGDTVQRFQVNSAGKIQWGPGGASAVDTDLYRSAANSLTTDGNLTVGLTFTSNAVAVSEASASGKIIQITNTTGAPTAANALVTSNGATDNALGLSVSGDTVNRLSVLASGKMNWGPGGGTAADTDLYRSAAGILSTDQTLTATTGVQVGGTTTTFGGGTGVLGISNASVVPTTNPSNAAVIYASTGGLLVRDAGGGVASMHSDPSTQAIYSPTQTPLGMTIPQYAVTSVSAAIITTGQMLMTAVWLPAGLKLTKMNMVTGTTAGATMTHWWMGVADVGGVQRAHTTDQTSGAIAASSVISVSFASTYTTTYSGNYWFIWSVSATTMPTLANIAAPASAVMGVIGGLASSGSSATPGTDGTTTYGLPSSQLAIPLMFAS